ncbi:MAG: hypothetical protein FWC89_01840 [Defluviitaleaceae bacterium]|nr:hypothetical protein [Defluviitaleaceae bacterium]
MKKKRFVVRNKINSQILIGLFFVVLSIVVIVGTLLDDDSIWLLIVLYCVIGMFAIGVIFAHYYWAIKVNENEILVREILKRTKKYSINQLKFVRIQSRMHNPDDKIPIDARLDARRDGTKACVVSVYTKNKCILSVDSKCKGYDQFLEFLARNKIKTGYKRGKKGDVTEKIILKGPRLVVRVGVLLLVISVPLLLGSILTVAPSGIIASSFLLVVALGFIRRGLKWKMYFHGNKVVLRHGFKKVKTYELDQLEIIMRRYAKGGLYLTLQLNGNHLTNISSHDDGYDEIFNFLLWHEFPITYEC